jgi:hypothetical protein
MWPRVKSVAADCTLTIAAETPHPATIARGKDIVQGRGVYCLNVGGVQIDQAVVEAFSEL